MAGERVDPIPAARLAAVAKAGAPRGAGGYLPASRRTATQTEHTPGRVLRPNPPAVPGEGGGVYIPVFTVTGDLAPAYFETALQNLTGRTLAVSRLFARVGQSPFGSATVISVYKDEDTWGTVSIPAASVTGNSAVSLTWGPEEYLTVGINSVGSTYGGSDLVLQVVTA